MKIVITSQGNTLDSIIDPRFGRCSYFAIFDTETEKVDFVENNNKDAAEGAGPASVAFVANKEGKKIVSGEFGFKIKGLLNELNIQMIIIKEDKTISEIVELIKENK